MKGYYGKTKRGWYLFSDYREKCRDRDTPKNIPSNDVPNRSYDNLKYEYQILFYCKIRMKSIQV